MAKRQARFTAQDAVNDPGLNDYSEELWQDGYSQARRRLLLSAVQCFATNGYHATTTRDITVGSGVTPAALYVHFESKEHILFEIVRAAHVAALDSIRTPDVLGLADAEDRLRAIVIAYARTHARYHVAARVAQYQLNGLSGERYAAILEIRHEINDIVRAGVEYGVANGTFAPLDVNRVGRAVQSLVVDLARWYRLDGADSPDEIGQFYADLVLRMLTRCSPSF